MYRKEWTNFATSCIYYSLINDEAACYSWMAYGRDALLKAQPDNTSSKRMNAQRILAGWLKNEIECGNPLKTGSIYSDILAAALSSVNWEQIAMAFLPEEAYKD